MPKQRKHSKATVIEVAKKLATEDNHGEKSKEKLYHNYRAVPPEKKGFNIISI